MAASINNMKIKNITTPTGSINQTSDEKPDDLNVGNYSALHRANNSDYPRRVISVVAIGSECLNSPNEKP
jgi:hypothetical protein